MSTLKVDGIRSNSASSDAITLASDGTCTANLTNKSNRNLVINGSMQVAQRGTSSTSDGYQTVDRFQQADGNTGVTVTQSQQSLSSSDTGPYEVGFRKYYRSALASAGTANTNAEMVIYSHLEAQDIANSGWNYTSASSYITLSFWFRCSTNQTFYFYFRSRDGSGQNYPFSFTASGNNTWTKVTKTIPGNSNLEFDNDNGMGLSFNWILFNGTDKTNNKTLNQWDAYSGSNVLPDMASTWLTAGASTFDVTGVQLEVGSVATDFEHRSYGQELALCQRYYYRTGDDGTTTNILSCAVESSSLAAGGQPFPTTMRALPTITIGSAVRFYSPATGTITFTVNANRCSTTHMALYLNISSGTEGQAASIYKADTSNGYVEASAEL